MKLIFVSIILLPVSLFAKTIFEPNLGVLSGGFDGAISGSSSVTNGTQVKASYNSLVAGVRYGITRRYIHVTGVADVYLTNVSGAEVAGITTAEDEGFETNFNLGIGIGYEWNIPIRTYIIVGFPNSGLEVSYYWSETFLIGLKYNRLEADFAGATLNANTFGLVINFPIEFDYPSNWWRKRDWE